MNAVTQIPALAITLVPSGMLHQALPDMVKLLTTSADWSRGRSSTDDILAFLFSGQMQLWMMFDPATWTPYAMLITEIKQYPQRKMFCVQYCAGEIGALEVIGEDMFQTLDSYARDAGCHGIEFYGRKGWSRIARRFGYDDDTVVYEKFYGEQP